MSNIDLIIEERPRDIGDFLVGRLLPFRKKRMVGPFIFIDHMGPTKMGPDHYMDVGQHPHIGLATLTFLLEGEVMHKDSIGTKQKIAPGSVNWMIAGNGVTHTERTPEELRHGKEYMMHGYQIWVALPKDKEDIDPEFHHFDRNDLPSWKDETAEFILVAGKGYGKESPVPVHSELFMVEIKTQDEYLLHTEGQLFGEIGICVVEGAVQACDNHVEKGNMLVSKLDNACSCLLYTSAGAILGADAFYYKKRPEGFDQLISGGRVVIEDNVGIGALCTIDRGVTGDTTISEGTKLDNQVHIGHDTVVGKKCLIAAQTGIAGCVKIMDEVTIWGQVGVASSLTIGERAVVMAQSGVTKSLEGDKTYFGTPADEAREKLKQYANVKKIPEILSKLK